MQVKVELFVYDLSQGMAAMLSHQLLGTHIEAIWHTSIVLGRQKEIYFGQGIQITSPPGSTVYGRPVQVIEMGHTELPADIIDDYIADLAGNVFTADRYHLLENNCNDFTNEVCQFLVGRGIPSHITGLPDNFLRTYVYYASIHV